MEDYSAFPSAIQSPNVNFSNPSIPFHHNLSASISSASCSETQNVKSTDNAASASLLSVFPSVRHSGKHLVGIDTPEPIFPFGGLSDHGSSVYGQESDGESRRRALSDRDGASVPSEDLFPLSVKPLSCDVYVGFYGRKPSLCRFANWLRAELELQGVSCFMVDRSRCRDGREHCMVESAMNAASFGVVIIQKKSFSNAYSIDEFRLFSNKKNLIPIFFGLDPAHCQPPNIVEKRGELWKKYGGELWLSYGGSEKGWKEAVNGLSLFDGYKLVANAGNWRDCISDAVILLGMRLGRRSVVEGVKRWKQMVAKEEHPFPRNSNFIGRKEELLELELILFGNVEGDGKIECFELKIGHGQKTEMVAEKAEAQRKDSICKGKAPVIWRESEEEIEMEGTDGEVGPHWHPRGKSAGERHFGRKVSMMKMLYGKGIACVSGEPGVGKTELLLEFAYRFSQRYRMVLWVGGESRYIRQNYISLLPFLGVDIIENELCPERNDPKSFKELEEDAIRRVRKELMRDIPFLIVIDGLESEKDWWDARNVMELLPHFGGVTHVIISTCLPRILNMEPLRLSSLHGEDALSLMRGSLEYLASEEVNALEAMAEKLGGFTLGLAIVGAIVSELPISPSKLLNAINRTYPRDLKWNSRDDSMLRDKPFLVHLLDVFFSIFSLQGGSQNLAASMVLVSGWFAPSPIPISILASAAHQVIEGCVHTPIWKKCLNVLICRCMTSHIKDAEAEASVMLVRLRIARSCTKEHSIHFHDIIKLYSRKIGGFRVARAMVQAINLHGSLLQHADHIWAACFLVFRFGNEPTLVEMKIVELLFFIKRLVLPLASFTFASFSRCIAAKELLSSCCEALDAAEKSFISQANKSLHWIWPVQSTRQLDTTLYRELLLAKAALLETRVKLMLKGGEYDIAQDLHRQAISVKSVAYCTFHPETIAAEENLHMLVKFEVKNQWV